MNTLQHEPVAGLLTRLHQKAEAADASLMAQIFASMEATGKTIEQLAAEMMSDERSDTRKVYRSHADYFLSVSPIYGCFLYAMARASRATRIVEFGTSMGVSTIYLAAALRDNGGGTLIRVEEPRDGGRPNI